MLVYSVHSSVLLPEVMLPPGRGGGPLNWEGAGVTRTDPTVDIVSTRQVIIPLPAARSLGGLSPPETKKARTASIRSDPCPAGAFARLHHTQIKIFPADHTITGPLSHYYHFPSSLLASPSLSSSSRSVILWRKWCFEVSTIKERAGGLPLRI